MWLLAHPQEHWWSHHRINVTRLVFVGCVRRQGLGAGAQAAQCRAAEKVRAQAPIGISEVLINNALISMRSHPIIPTPSLTKQNCQQLETAGLRTPGEGYQHCRCSEPTSDVRKP